MQHNHRTNENAEQLLRIYPTTIESLFTIYDITAYFPHWQGREREQYMNLVTHTINGNNGVTVHIISDEGTLNQSQAEFIARGHYNGNFNNYRLD